MLPPKDEDSLIKRALKLTGCSLSLIAKNNKHVLPNNLMQNKGVIGQLLEVALGADTCNLDQPDFINLGIELKTIPVSSYGSPIESTYICYANLPPKETSWHNSRVQRKTAKILWIPYEGDKNIPLPSRQIGSPYLWEPNLVILNQMKNDWEEITELMMEGRYEELSAKKGKIIQLRPKAANSKTLIQVTNEQGEPIHTVPKGFYFRRSFTNHLFSKFYAQF
jgi:DNA mismatch repair protein MutH